MKFLKQTAWVLKRGKCIASYMVYPRDTLALGCRALTHQVVVKLVAESLRPTIWPFMWSRSKGGDWHLRANMECQICKAERARRCCVIQQNDESFHRYTAEPFATAPYVHPFRAPAYHAQQLRTLNFAKANRRRVLWLTAFDRMQHISGNAGEEKQEERKEQWLQFHERFTNGIPGLLPLVLDLPVRFTESPNKTAKNMGVFKHSRDILRGWQLPQDEQKRIDEGLDPEVVLKKRPDKLFIEVFTGNNLMPTVDGRKIYSLQVQCRQWTLDKAGAIKIMRHGFPIVPDFGGTAHAYCGTTLEACLGDLLAWHGKPSHELSLRGYIIKSRVKRAENILLAEPYSPNLFQQGDIPGPTLLMKVLQGELTYK